MDSRKDLLLASAARLYSIGVDLEAARERLRQLVQQGAAYDSDAMKQALAEFRQLETLWKSLEREHLSLRAELLETPGGPSQ